MKKDIFIPLGNVQEINNTFYYNSPTLTSYLIKQNLNEVKNILTNNNKFGAIYETPTGYDVKLLSSGKLNMYIPNRHHQVSNNNIYAPPKFIDFGGEIKNINKNKIYELMVNDYLLQTQDFKGNVPIGYYELYQNQNPVLFDEDIDEDIDIPNITATTSDTTIAAIIMIVGLLLVVFFSSRQINIITY